MCSIFHFLLIGSRRFRVTIQGWLSVPEEDRFYQVQIKHCFSAIHWEITQWCLHRQRTITLNRVLPSIPHHCKLTGVSFLFFTVPLFHFTLEQFTVLHQIHGRLG